MSSRGGEARRAADKALVHDGYFQEVLSQRARLVVVVVRLAYPAQEAHRARPSQLEPQHAQHEALRLEDLLYSVASIHHIHNFLDGWAVDLLILGRDENRSGPDQLQLTQRDNLARQESVDAIDAQEQSLREEGEAIVHLDQPIHEHRPHRPLDFGLVVHVMRIGKHPELSEG